MKALTVCPGHLAEGFDRYCPSCTRRLFDGKRVSPQLDFDYDADSADMAESINQLSVSGVQEKLSAIVHPPISTCGSVIRSRPMSI